MGVRHSKVSSKPDGEDASLIQASDWNAEHAVDWAESGDLRPIGAAGSTGSSTRVARADHTHPHAEGYLPDAHHPKLHAADHVAGGADALVGDLDAVARVEAARNGSLVGSRRRVNFVEGSGVSITVSDVPASERLDVVIASTGGGGGGGAPLGPMATVTLESGTYYARRPDGSVITSGANAVTVINSAISTVSSSGGGEVVVAASCGAISVGSTPITLASGVRLVFESAWGRNGDAVNPQLYGASLVAATGATDVVTVPSGVVGAEVVRPAIDGSNIASRGIRSSAFDTRIVAPCVIRCTTGIRLDTSLAQVLAGPFLIRACTTGLSVNATDCIVCGPGRILNFTTGMEVTAGGFQASHIHMTSGTSGAIGLRVQAQFPVMVEDVIFDSINRPVQLDGTYGEVQLTNCSMYTGSTAEPAAIYANAPGRIVVSGLRVFDSGSTWTNVVRFAGSIGQLLMWNVLVDASAVTGAFVSDGSRDLSYVHEPWNGFVTSGIGVM